MLDASSKTQFIQEEFSRCNVLLQVVRNVIILKDDKLKEELLEYTNEAADRLERIAAILKFTKENSKNFDSKFPELEIDKYPHNILIPIVELSDLDTEDKHKIIDKIKTTKIDNEKENGTNELSLAHNASLMISILRVIDEDLSIADKNKRFKIKDTDFEKDIRQFINGGKAKTKRGEVLTDLGLMLHVEQSRIKGLARHSTVTAENIHNVYFYIIKNSDLDSEFKHQILSSERIQNVITSKMNKDQNKRNGLNNLPTSSSLPDHASIENDRRPEFRRIFIRRIIQRQRQSMANNSSNAVDSSNQHEL